MKGITHYIKGLLVLCVAVCSGCEKDPAPTPPVKGKVPVVMNGSIKPTTKAAIEPNTDGSPQGRLVIGIITSDYYLPTGVEKFDPGVLQPEDWGMYTYLDRGHFGGDTGSSTGSGGVITYVSGNIKYTNADGTSIQNVFYDEMGMYYTLRLIHPYEYKYVNEEKETIDVNAKLILSSTGSQVLFDVDGSQDIMSSDVGWGNMDSPDGKVITTDKVDATEKEKSFRFHHQLVKLDLRLIAEDKASALYGKIGTVELINQPNQLLLDIASDKLTAASNPVSKYTPVDHPTDSITLTATLKDCGYVMALPDSIYTFRITTANRLNFYIDAVFEGGAVAGTAYPITFKFLASDEIELYAGKAEEWWYNSVFN